MRWFFSPQPVRRAGSILDEGDVPLTKLRSFCHVIVVGPLGKDMPGRISASRCNLQRL
jgi:hypothetical protein